MPAVVAVVSLVLGVGPVGADTPDPSSWPTGLAVDPGIDATAHSLRIAGADRTQTALSAALLLRGGGGYPFSTADRTSGDATTLGDADQWWGLGTCPFSVIVTAGDAAPDSLAAASLSDPTDGSSEPTLTRSATADEFLAPVGATSKVDTDSAPIIVTASGRQGATRLSTAARTAVTDLANGGCDTVRAAIVVGGTNAVPAGVDDELIDLGLDQVFRVAGSDRFATAADIARALGTGDAHTNTRCDDPNAADGDADMGFYGNAAVELRTSPTDCEVLGRTVVLTDGITGADALAAGWWTSTWQVPVLLVDGAGDLPAATRSAMNSLVIDNVVVLGGQARVPDQTVAEVGSITGAEVVRVAGADRYETSVDMAEAFGGWFPTNDGTDHDGSMVCLAASSGSGSASIGWADALGAGPWCAAAGGLASDTPAPVRGLPPVSGAHPRVTRGLEPSHDAVPVLLTPVAADTLAEPVAGLLADTFDPTDTWCSSVQADDSCLDPGFAVTFGGTAVVTDAVVRQSARAVSGQTYVSFDDQSPTADGGFWTELDLRPVYAQGGVPDAEAAGRVCADRGALEGVRWLATYADALATVFGAAQDLLAGGLYATDRDGTARTPGISAPTCVRVPDSESGIVDAFGVSLSGQVTDVGTYRPVPARTFELSDPIVQIQADVHEGTDTYVDGDDGSSTRVVFADDGLDGIVAVSRTEPATVSAATLDLRLTRGNTPTEPDELTGTLSLTTSLGTVIASVAGEAIFTDGTWQLRGRTAFTGGTWNATEGTGGFAADLIVNSTDTTDDRLEWRIDALLSAPTS